MIDIMTDYIDIKIWPSLWHILRCIKGIVSRQYIDTTRIVVNDGELLGTILNIG